MSAGCLGKSKVAQRESVPGIAAPEADHALTALTNPQTGSRSAPKGDTCKVKGEIGSPQTDIIGAAKRFQRDMMIRLGGMLLIAGAELLAAIRYLPPHPQPRRLPGTGTIACEGSRRRPRR